MSPTNPPFALLPDAPVATRIEAAEPDNFGIPKLLREGPSVTGLHPSWAGWFSMLKAFLTQIPKALAYQNAVATSLVNGTFTTLNFDTAAFNNLNVFSATNKFTAPVAACYLIGAQVQCAAAAGVILISTLKNGATVPMPHVVESGAPNNANAGFAQISSIVQLVAGDFIQFQAFQNSGGALNTITGGFTWGSMHLLSRP